jgi:hypothetical protein
MSVFRESANSRVKKPKTNAALTLQDMRRGDGVKGLEPFCHLHGLTNEGEQHGR